MGKVLFVFVLTLSFYQIYGQSLTEITRSLDQRNIPGKVWLEVEPGQQTSAQDFLRAFHGALGLGENDVLELESQITDELGMTHYRYKQFHQGLPVDGGELLLHEQNGRLISVNGWVVPGLDITLRASASPLQALGAAIEFLPAETYLWEDAFAEKMLKRIRKDPLVSYFPDPELILADPSFSHDPAMYRPVYKVLIHAREPAIRSEVYVDAYTGQVLEELDVLHTQFDGPVNNVNGQAQTKYSGLQPIITDSIAPDTYRLAETVRGGGVFTLDLNTSTNEQNAVDFLDEDNFWNNFNAKQDEAATDAHWGAEMTFDYLLEKHNWEGVDGRGMPLISYVHYDNEVTNAFWFGTFARFGDGNGMNSTALTSIDVVAHEFLHGVTDFTADLRYRNESGALNESFSDIFGAAVEFFAKPDSADWFMGEDFQFGNYFRNMADPNDKNDPDTYLGDFWFTGSGDNGGVHTNSGVQNYWFYLLTEGGGGTNDLGDDFLIEGLGLDDAAKVAFRNLQYYLSEDSDYFDARLGSLLAAEDLFGECSWEVSEVARAWHAVGVGAKDVNNDLEASRITAPVEVACGLSDNEPVSITFTLRGCAPMAEGTSIPLAYQVDEYPVFRDTIELFDEVVPGQEVRHAYSLFTPALVEPVRHVVKAWTEFPTDGNPRNDTVTIVVDNIIAQNSDLSLETIHRPVAGCFLSSEMVSVRIGFFGCDSLPKGTPVDLHYQIAGRDPAIEEFEIPRTLYRGDYIDYSFQTRADLGSQGRFNINTWVDFGADFLNANDSLFDYQVLHVNPLPYAAPLTFEGAAEARDSFYVTQGKETDVAIQSNILNTIHVLRISGGDFWDYFREGLWVVTDSADVWEHNEDFGAKSCICVDLSGMDEAKLYFDLKQTYSPEYADRLHQDYRWASAMRVTVDGVQAGPSFFPKTSAGDIFREREIDLNDFAGVPVEICFETRCATNRDTDPEGLGDNVLIDNIRVGDLTTSVEEEVPVEIAVFPNPAHEFFRVQRLGLIENGLLEVFDISGHLLYSLPINNNIEVRSSALIHTKSWSEGTYILRITGSQVAFSEKLIIQHK